MLVLLLAATFISALGCGGGALSPQIEAPPLPVVDAAAFPEATQDAVRETLVALENTPANPDQNGLLGMLLHAHGRLGEAADCYARAESFDPTQFRWPYLSGVTLAANGRLEEAVAAFDRALSIQTQSAAQIRLAEALRSLGRGPESRQAFEEAVQVDPRAAPAFYGLGRILAEEGQAEEALPLLRKALELAPMSGAIRYSLGLALRDAAPGSESEAMLASAESLNRSLPPLDDPILREVEALRRDEHWLLNEGRRREESGDLSDAVALYLEAVELAPDFASAEANLVGAYGKLKRFDDAEKHYRRALGIAQDLEELHNNWGVIQAQRGNAAAAKQAFRRALEINPYSVDANFNLGVAEAGDGNAAEAAGFLERTIELQPNHRLALFQLGRLLVLQGRLDEGIRHLQASAEGPQEPVRPAALYALGVGYARAQQYEKAEESLARALREAESMGLSELAASIRESLHELAAEAHP